MTAGSPWPVFVDEPVELPTRRVVVGGLVDREGWVVGAERSSYTRCMTECPRCGQENRSEAGFCDACGFQLAPTTPAREERKVVSVLFADLVGFTATAEQLDPEDVRALQDPYWQHVRSEIERHGGTVEKFIGDAVVALFGAPVAHEDDPERAVRAAFAIRDWARAQEDVQVRIAIVTGEALVRLGAQPLAGEGMASGDVVNTAARLQASAPPNGILVGAETYRATKDAVDYTNSKPISAKGKAESLAVWEAVGARSRLGVDVAHHARTLLVGREHELDVLRDALARARYERSPQLVTLIGVPGIGKSRLVYELMRSVEADPELVRWRQGRSLPYGDGVAFWALGEIVKGEAGILETDATEVAHQKLERVVEGLVAENSDWVMRHLRPLIGLAPEGERGDGRDEAFAAWRTFLESLAEQRPSVFVFEDLHWADDGLLDFVDQFVEWASRVPMLVVCTARPELLDRRPGWGGGKLNTSTLALSALSDDETTVLLDATIDLAGAEAREALLERVGGNPLYAEQFALLVGGRTLLDDAPLPSTVQGIIAARLDALPPEEKQLVQDAAVIGKVFWNGALYEELSAVSSGLHALERKEFVRRERRSVVEGEQQYSFSHVLVRDVAYGQIPRAARAGKHLRVAEWLESLGRPDDHPDLLAHHYLAALELTRAAGGTDGALATRARLALVQAGDRASGINAFRSAARYYAQALELSPDTDAERAQLLFAWARALFGAGDEQRMDALVRARRRLLATGEVERAAEADVLIAEVWWLRGQSRNVDAHLERAAALVRGRPPSAAHARVLSSIARFRMLADDHKEAIRVGREALLLAEMLDLTELRAESLVTLGTSRTEEGDLAEGLADIERGLELALEANALSAALRAYNNLAVFAGKNGEYPRRLELLLEAERLAQRLGNPEVIRSMRAEVIASTFVSGRWEEALKQADAFLAECEAGSPHRTEAAMRLVRAELRLARDDEAGALEDTAKLLGLAHEDKDPHIFLAALSFSARLKVELGLLDEARKLAAEALSYGVTFTDEYDVAFDFVWHMEPLRLTAHDLQPLVDSIHPSFRLRQAVELLLAKRFEELADLLAELGSKEREPQVRLRAAEQLIAERRYAEAERQLRKALSFYRTVAATRYIRQAEALLSASNSAQERQRG
jgi:class 3 adenylate cyclase/tetratricopeptide (TPR) repeat protein